MKEVICVNGTFNPDTLAFYAQWGVRVPQQDGLYTIDELIFHTAVGKKGVRLAELKNPQVPVKTPLLGQIRVEPTFCLTRFRELSGEPISEEAIQEMKKVQNQKIDKKVK